MTTTSRPTRQGAGARGDGERDPATRTATGRRARVSRGPATATKDRDLIGRLYDATGEDRDVAVDASLVRELGKNQTLWVDLESPDEATLERLGKAFELRPETVRALHELTVPPRVAFFDTYLLMGVVAIESPVEDGTVPLALVAGSNFVVTVRPGPAACLAAIRDHVRGETGIGAIDGPAFLAALLDWHLTVYFQAVDRLEREADRLDHRALHPRSERDLLDDLVHLRRRISNLRRALAPQREAFAALTHPELFGLGDPEDTVHFRALADRLERAIDAVEVARELVLGSFDVHMTRTAQRTNDVMKLLTLVTVILLPGSVIAGVMGMNFDVPLFEEPALFWVVIIAMVAIAVGTLVVARARRWI